MKIELDRDEVRDALEEAATKLILPGRTGVVDTVVLHTAGGGGATVTFLDPPHREPPEPEQRVGDPEATVTVPTVKEAETKAKTAAKGKAK